MAKKNFSSGLDSIFEGAKDKIPASDNASTLPIDAQQLEELKAIAYWEGRDVESIIKEAIDFYLDFQVDKKPIPIPKR